MNQAVAVQNPRSTFLHGADCTVKFISQFDDRGAFKEKYAVAFGNQKVYFEMMRLKPRTHWEEQHPRSWGFGDIFDAVTGVKIWTFNTFARPLNFKGDMTTERGEDNRTYVVCRARDGEVKHRFLLAKLLPRWEAFANIPVPALPPPALQLPPAVADVLGLPPPALQLPPVFEVVTEPEQVALAVVPRVVAKPAESAQVVVKVARETLPQVASKPVVLVDKTREMRQFVEEVLSRMPRAPEYLRS